MIDEPLTVDELTRLDDLLRRYEANHVTNDTVLHTVQWMRRMAQRTCEGIIEGREN